MGLKSFLQRKEKPATDTADVVALARTRARQRLIGAVVLLGIGIVGFPLLFETQPRPIPVDIPIEIPRKERVAPLPVPAAPAAAVRGAAAEPVPDPAPASASPPPVIEERAADAGREVPPREPAPAPPAATPAPRVTAPASERASSPSHGDDRAVAKPAVPASAPSTARKPAGDDAARAQALLEGKPAAANGRFIVQVGAFADAGAAREARLKVERLGLKTYTQAVDTPGGKRIRVRVGPFASRDEADKAASKLKSGGLASAVLTL